MLGWWILSPISAMLSFISVTGWLLPGHPVYRVVSHDDKQRHVIRAMVAFTFVVMALATLPSHLKNLRYVTFIYGTSYLLSGLGLRYVLALCKAELSSSAFRWALGAAAMIVVGSMLADYFTYQRMFIKDGMNDLAVIRLIDSAFKLSSGS